MNNGTDDLFGPPIFSYTDVQAVEDGVLVSVPGEGGVNRVTRAVFNHFVKLDGRAESETRDTAPLMEAIRTMLTVPPNNGWRVGVYQGKELWLIPNEVGGLTLMFPDDY